MRMRQSEERFRDVGSGSERTSNGRPKLVDAIFLNPRKRSVGVALLAWAFVVGGAAAFDASNVRANEPAVAVLVETTTSNAFEYKIEGIGATITGLREEFRTATAIRIPEQIGEVGVKKIESNAFAGLERLETLDCDAPLTEMGDRAFADCGSLKQVRFRAPITEIGREAFAGCGGLQSVEHDEILNVAEGAFSGCAGLATFDVAGISEVAPNAFAGCRSLAKFENSATQNQRLQVVDGLVLSQDGRRLIACPTGRKGEIVVPEGVVWIAESACFNGAVESLVLPQTLETVGEKAFAYCAKLKSVVGAPKTLETIRAEAFAGCAALERFDWPENLRIVEKSAFQLCGSLKSATLNNVRSVGERAFSACSELATLELSSETREIGAFAFAQTALKSFKIPRELETLTAWALDWGAFENVEVEEGNQSFKIVDGAVLSADGKTLYYRPAKAPGASWKIPEGVRVVVRGALANNESLVSVEIPEGVETIGEGAFNGCLALRKLAIPASVRRIDDRFERCYALETFEVAEGNPAYRSVDGALLSKDGKTLYRVAREGGAGMTRTVAYWNGREVKRVIPEGVERIASGAIGDDRLMTSVEIPETVKRIDAGAFGVCDRLSSLVIPASVERLDERFEGCDALEKFDVASANRNYRSSFGALLSKDSKTYYSLVGKGDWARSNISAYEYSVPHRVQTIKQNAFGGAWRMEKIVLPQGLRTIERSAFSGATSLTSVTIPASVEKIEKGAFVGAPLREVVLESSSAKFDKSAFTTEPAKLTIRVADETLERERAAAEAKKAAAEAKKAAEKVARETFLWKIESNGSATITGVRDKTTTALDIPENIDGAPVNALADGAFANLSRLKTARIGANVERIDGAFRNCVNLESVEFPSASDGAGESKLHIINAGFEGCASLKKFVAPYSLVTVSFRAFSNCSSLETVELSPRTLQIDENAFLNCSALREFNVPKEGRLRVVGKEAFKGCDALKSFDAPRSLAVLGWNAFGEQERSFQFNLHPESELLRYVDGMLLSGDGKRICAYFGPKTGELVIPEGVERVEQVFGSIAKGADFETIRLPKSLRVIQRQAFMQSKSLKKVELPADSALEEIGDSAFSGCEALESFAWPKSLKKIGISAFYGCRLKELVGVPALESIDNFAFAHCGTLSTVELPSGLREIGRNAFAECGFASIKIPASVQTLGETAFAMNSLEKIEVEEGSETLKVVDGALLTKDGKSLHRLPAALNLTSYKIPDGVEIIERAALGGNVTLESVEIPATVKTIAPNAFYRCVALKKVSIPASVETMNYAFIRCDALEQFEVDPNNPVYKSENGALLSKDGKTFYGIVAVERDAEAEAKAAAETAASEGVDAETSKPIYKNPVYRVPDGVEKIASSAFSDDAGMRNAFTEIVLPESVKEIGRYAFVQCSRLEKAFLPKNVAKIGDGLFKRCGALKTIEISPENPNFRTENGMLLSRDGRTLYDVFDDRGETVLTIPDGVEGVVDSSAWTAFEEGPTYTEVVLPESLTTIAANAFAGWANLNSITIPKTTRNVERRAFIACPLLAEVVFKSGDTTWNDGSFERCAPNLKIRVEEPESEASEEAAQAAPVKSSDSDATAADATVSDAFEWREIRSGEVSIFGVRDKTATTVVIPETLGGTPVKSIAINAFAGMRELKTVRLPRNLETICATAFTNCVKLEKVEFAKDENGAVASRLQSVHSQAFKGCVSLKSFEAPDSLVQLVDEAFAGCSALETATLGKNLSGIQGAAFADCVSLKRVDCSRCEKLTGILANAFWGCDALSTFDAPKSLRVIDGAAFGGRTTPFAFNLHPESAFLKTVDGCVVTKANNRLVAYFGERNGVLVVPDGVEEIGSRVFLGAAFETVRLPQSLRGVGNFAFASCESLKHVEIPEDSALDNVGESAFASCEALETFDWPRSLKRVGDSAFSGCASLKSLTGATSLESIGASAFCDCKSLATVELPNGLREIGACAFLNDGFASLKIPASVDVLGPAGVACTGLEKIEVEEGNEILKVVDGALLSKDGKRLHRLPPALKTKSYKIPDGVEIVGRSALGGNVTLETVELPASVTTIEKDAFHRCLALKEIAIPAKTSQIDKDAFVFCDALERFEIDPNNAVYKSENGALLSKDGKTFYGVVAVERDPNAEPFVVEPAQEGEEPRLVAAYKSPIYRVPDGVATLSNNAFFDPKRARNAFTEIVLPESLSVVGTNAFDACERLETIRIPANVTRLGALIIADSAHPASFPQFVFATNRALKTFEVAPENKTYRSEDGMLLSADGIVCYAVCANKDRSVLKVPDGVVRIASWAFNEADATEIVLPEKLDFILTSTFRDCENLTSIEIPKNVKEIHPEAFYNCPRLAEVVLKSSDTLYFSNSFAKVAPNLTIRVEEDEPSQEKEDGDAETPPTSEVNAVEPARTSNATSVSSQAKAVEPAKSVAVAAVAKTLKENDFKWRKKNDGATITGVKNKAATEVVIPETLGGLPVKAIGPVAFALMSDLKTVRISQNLETIGSRAFSGCVKLETVEFAKDGNGDIASRLRKIDDHAFWKCAALKSFAAPDSLVELGGWAFCDCSSLETAKLGKNLQDIASFAFANCDSLSRVDTSTCEKLTGIANDAFRNCGALSSFDAPKSLRYVQGTSFAGRSTPLAFNLDPESEFLKLVDGCLITKADEEVNDNRLVAYFGGRDGEVVVPEGVVDIFLSAFAGADFETVRLPKSVRVINNEAFKDCKSLKRVVIPEDSDLAAIGNTAFGGCESLETFDWPKSLKAIGPLAFVDCQALKSFTGATSVEEIRDSAFGNCRSLTTVELPSVLRQVDANAFANVGYETLKIPASLQVLGESAFASLSPREKLEVEEGSETLKIVDGALLSKDGKTFYRLPLGLSATSYKVPEGVEIIEYGAFRENATLETVELPSSLRMIKKKAFYRCSALKGVAIPANVKQIDVEAFDGCDALERFDVDSNNAVYKSENGALLSADGKRFYKLIAVAERDRDAEKRFLKEERLQALRSVEKLPNGEVRSLAPSYMDAKAAIVPVYKNGVYRVPDGVTTISDGAFFDPFKNRNAFKEIVLPEGLVVIGANAFCGCSRLETLRIPASVSQLGSSAALATTTLFTDCDALKTFEVAPENKTFRSKDGILLNAYGTVFYGVVANKKRNVLQIPAGVEHLTGELNFGDPGQIIFPDSLRSIPQAKFRNLQNLTSVTISKNIYQVDSLTFIDCPRLAEVVLRSEATVCNDEAFVRCAPNLTIRVDRGEGSEAGNGGDEASESATAKENAASPTSPVVPFSPLKSQETSNEGALITGVYDKNATTIEIPETLDGLRVVTIGSAAFAEMRELRTVRIPASVETIRSDAFRDCVKLEKIEFAQPSNGEGAPALKTVEERAFMGCRSLKSFEAPDSLVRVGTSAFEGGAALETIALGQNVANVERRAFANCVSLRRVDFSKARNMNYFDPTAFEGTSPELETLCPVDNPRFTSDGFALSQDGKKINAYLGKRSGEIAIPEGVERIENGFFWRFTNVETIRLPKSLRSIGDRAFYRCESLKRVVVPEDSALETIGVNAFSECFALERFDWPKSLKTIGVSAFAYCRSLKSFTGATSVRKIDNSAFSDCVSLTEVELPSGLLEIGPSAFAECGFTSIKIPASVRVIGDAALALTSLKTIEVEEGNEAVKVVDGALLSKDGKSFFRLPPALKLKSYKIPDGVEIVERAALGGNATLESVEIPASVATIERNAFYRNSSLTEIFIPAGVASLDDAFPLCDSLERFEVDAENAVYKSENGALLSKDGKTFYRIVAVERDPNGAPIVLDENENLAKPTKRDEGPREIPAYKNDVYVVPEGVETLAANAFSDVRRTRNAFTEIVLPQSLKKIEERVFQHCSRLETLRIPANVSRVGGNAFLGCDALKTFEVAPENRVLSAKDGLLLSDDGKMACCVVANQNRRVLKLPEGVERAQSNETASKKFAELVLPESLTEIKTSAFANCENLTKVTIPKNVRLIGARAFSNSPKLEEIVLKSSATRYELNAFEGVAPNCRIRVDEEPSDVISSLNIEIKPEDATTLEEAAKLFDFVFDGNAATITGCRDAKASELKIPAKIDDKIVVKIDARAFYGSRFLQTVELPPTLREIGSGAFASCSNLETVSPLPAALETIGVGAFDDCSTLTAFEVDPQNKAFQSVDGVLLNKGGKLLYVYPAGKRDKTWQVPDGVETIMTGAFLRNAFLETVKFPWTLKAIKSEAFMGCAQLAEVRFFPVVNCLASIGERAFFNCNSLKSVNLPDGIRLIESRAFGGNALETVEFYPVDVDAAPTMTIASGAFDAPNLKSFEFPETLKSLENGAVKSGVRNPSFTGEYDEYAQLVATLPPNLDGVEPGAFSEMANLVEIKIDPACERFKTVDGALLSADGKTLYYYPKTKRAAEFDVPNGVEHIVSGAFVDARVRKIRTPKTLKQVDVKAFGGSYLETLEIGEGVCVVNPGAVGFCGGLTTLTLPSTLQNADRVVEGCPLRLPKLANLEIASENSALKTVDGLTLSADGKTLYFCSQEKGSGEVVVPDGVETIADWAFARRSLESIRLPKTLKRIGTSAFAFCENLTSASLPNGLEVVGERAFQSCGALSSISLPASVNAVEQSAFASCGALKSIDVAAENPAYRNVDGVLLSKDGRDVRAYPCGKDATEYVVPDGVETTAAFAFHGAKKLRKVVLPKGFKSQGFQTFFDCQSDLEVVRP